MAEVVTLSMDREVKELLEKLSYELRKPKSKIVRELIHEKAKELGITAEKPATAQASS